jgi:recombination protein RecR
VARVQREGTTEIVFALSPTIQGDTTIYYVRKKLNKPELKFTTIARGISFGGELEYADEMTLAKSIRNRLPVDSYIQ